MKPKLESWANNTGLTHMLLWYYRGSKWSTWTNLGNYYKTIYYIHFHSPPEVSIGHFGVLLFEIPVKNLAVCWGIITICGMFPLVWHLQLSDCYPTYANHYWDCCRFFPQRHRTSISTSLYFIIFSSSFSSISLSLRIATSRNFTFFANRSYIPSLSEF